MLAESLIAIANREKNGSNTKNMKEERKKENKKKNERDLENVDCVEHKNPEILWCFVCIC